MDHVEAPVLADLNLDDASVLIVGAYKGDTVAFILKHHPKVAKIQAFEPQNWVFVEFTARFSGDDRVSCVASALGTETTSAMLSEFFTDAASLLPLEQSRHSALVSVVDAKHIRKSLYDLCVMNIEGYEYTLIPYMLDLKIVVRQWLIQFHFQDRMIDQLAITRDLLAAKYSGTVIGKGWELWQQK